MRFEYPGRTHDLRFRSRVCQRLTGITWNFDLGNIPNEENFVFLGLLTDGSIEWCRVVKGEDGCYTVENGKFQHLQGWRRNTTQYGQVIRPEMITNAVAIPTEQADV